MLDVFIFLLYLWFAVTLIACFYLFMQAIVQLSTQSNTVDSA